MTTITPRPRVNALLRTAAVLWVVWGLVHMFAGIATIGRDTPEAVDGIADGVDLAALVGGLADVGYFVFLDLGGYVNFFPGTLMTIFSATAIVTSFCAAYIGRPDSSRDSNRGTTATTTAA